MQSDALNTLEQTHDFKDDQFDFIQQTLRCICMKCNVSVFFLFVTFLTIFQL